MNYGPTFVDQSSGYPILNMTLWSNHRVALVARRAFCLHLLLS
jgi:hypothetical protein